VCATDFSGCKVLRVRDAQYPSAGHGSEASDVLIASLSPDHTRVAVLVPQNPERGIVHLDLFDIASQKRIARHTQPLFEQRPPVFQDISDLWTLRWLTPRFLLLSGHRCCGPDGSNLLLDLSQRSFEFLGNPSLFKRVKEDLWLAVRADTKGFRGDPASTSLDLFRLDLGRPRRPPLSLAIPPHPEPEAREIDGHPWKDPTWVFARTSPPELLWVNIDLMEVTHRLPLPLCR
jgi:hypothetical protein